MGSVGGRHFFAKLTPLTEGAGSLVVIERSKRPVGATRIADLARQLLDASTLCAIATVSPRGRAHVNTAYFAWSSDLQLVWLSERRARHSQNLQASATTAVAVYDSRQTWGEPDSGIQLFGSAHALQGHAVTDAARIYGERFSAYRPTDLTSYALYAFRPHRIKLFDERSLGAGVFVTARVTRAGRLAWEKTETYRSSS
jgi:uncharacterized protein YhbP (UPF0306 family)